MKSLLKNIIKNKDRYLSGAGYQELIGNLFNCEILAHHDKKQEVSYISINISANDLAPMSYSGSHVASFRLKKEGGSIPTMETTTSSNISFSRYDTRPCKADVFDHEKALNDESKFMSEYLSLINECCTLPRDLVEQLFDMIECFHENHEDFLH